MRSISDVQAYVQLTRPQNATGGLLTYSIGYFLVASTLGLDYFTGLIILLVLHSLATVQNDIEDFEIDRANKRKGALQEQSLSLPSAKLFVQVLAFTALVVALLSPNRKLYIIVFTGLLLLAWLYNLNPIRVSKRPILSIVFMGLCYGALPLVFGYLVAGGNLANPYFLILALLWFIVRFSTSIMKDYKDAKGDKMFNKNTFYLRYGRMVTGWTSITMSIIAYTGIILVLAVHSSKGIASHTALALAVLLALRGIILRLKLVKTSSEKQLNIIFHKCVFGHNQFEVAVLLCLILSLR